VGEDQKAHVELGREIVRRFNGFYSLSVDRDALLRGGSEEAGLTLRRVFLSPPSLTWESALSGAEISAVESKMRQVASEIGIDNFRETYRGLTSLVRWQQILSEPEVMLTHTPRIPGLDGRKMSKSYGNAIMLSESDEEIRKKTKVMVTDPARKRRTDAGNPDVCPVFDWHKLFSPPQGMEKGTQAWAAHGCRTAGIGCIECKAAMADNLIKWIEPVRQRRQDYEQQPQQVLEYLDVGSKRARMVAQQTMDRVREAVFHWSEKRGEIRRSGQAKKSDAIG
jgi:tryptophanyl-tRNA synthetase